MVQDFISQRLLVLLPFWTHLLLCLRFLPLLRLLSLFWLVLSAFGLNIFSWDPAPEQATSILLPVYYILVNCPIMLTKLWCTSAAFGIHNVIQQNKIHFMQVKHYSKIISRFMIQTTTALKTLNEGQSSLIAIVAE